MITISILQNFADVQSEIRVSYESSLEQFHGNEHRGTCTNDRLRIREEFTGGPSRQRTCEGGNGLRNSALVDTVDVGIRHDTPAKGIDW